MYVAVVPNRGSPPAILLRESYREAGKTKNRTLANLSRWPAERIEQLRAVLRGDKLLPAAAAVEIVRAPPPQRWRAAALRRHLHLSRRTLLRTGAAWLQPRPPWRPAAASPNFDFFLTIPSAPRCSLFFFTSCFRSISVDKCVVP